MKKLINYFKSWGTDKWAHFGIGGLICALITIIFLFTLNPIIVSWKIPVAILPGLILVGILSVIKERTDSTGFSIPDIIAALLGCVTVEIALIIGTILGMLSV